MVLLSNWNFSLENYDSVWKLVVQIGLLLIFLLIGNGLRNLIPFLKKSLIPSSLIGGLLLLITNIILKAFDVTLIDKGIMQVVTYHGLAIGFIAMTLKTVKTKNKVGRVKMFENGIMTGGAYMLQAFVGLGITLLFFMFSKNSDKPIY